MPSGYYGDITIDVSGTPYETGFKFNTLPFGGMTIDAGNAVRIGSASDVKLTPSGGKVVILETTGSVPSGSESLRGALFIERGGGGSADKLRCCLKSAAGTYSFVVVATG